MLMYPVLVSSAGIAAIIKTSQVPRALSGDFGKAHVPSQTLTLVKPSLLTRCSRRCQPLYLGQRRDHHRPHGSEHPHPSRPCPGRPHHGKPTIRGLALPRNGRQFGRSLSVLRPALRRKPPESGPHHRRRYHRRREENPVAIAAGLDERLLPTLSSLSGPVKRNGPGWRWRLNGPAALHVNVNVFMIQHNAFYRPTRCSFSPVGSS